MIGLTITLKHSPNPDIAGGYWDEPVDTRAAKHVLVYSLKRAQEQVQAYIARNGLGGGNWTGGDLRLDGTLIGRISYNGRAWKLDGTEMDPSDPLLGDYAATPKAKRAPRARRHKGEEARQLTAQEQLNANNQRMGLAAMSLDQLNAMVVAPPPRSALLATVTK
jgi:hypothetical protein